MTGYANRGAAKCARETQREVHEMGWNAWVAAVFLTLTFPATLPAAGSMTPDRDRESTYEKGR